MSTYYTHTDKNKGNLLTSADWNKLGNAVAGNQGLHLALDVANKVGIGTSSPGEKLEVNGKVKATHFVGDGSQLTNLPSGSGLNGITTNGGNVGIGTNDPKAALSILGDGKEDWPDGSMHITSDCILFGGKNSGKEVNSAQISAGRHQADTLCIVGMGSTANNRKIKMWAEGGLAVSGAIKVPYKGGNEASISIGDNSFHNGNIYALRFGDSETNQLGMGTYTSDKKVFSDSSNGLGIHVKNNAEFSVKSSGWDNLFGIKGGTGNAYFKGNVGIGTTNPGAKLEVSGKIYAGNSDIYFTKTNHGHTAIGNTSGYAAIENSNNYDCLMILGRAGTSHGRSVKVWDRLEVCGSFVNNSDERIKKDIQISDSKKDLSIINKLKVSNFKYIDNLNRTDLTDEKKLIAQQVKEVFPQAVTYSKNYIPSIYQLSKKVTYSSKDNHLTIKMGIPHNLTIGDNVRLIHDEKDIYCSVIRVINSKDFIVSHDESLEKVFVYGKMVEDLMSIDYIEVSMLGISGIQELSKENKQLKTQLKTQFRNIEELKKALEKLTKKVDGLKK